MIEQAAADSRLFNTMLSTVKTTSQISIRYLIDCSISAKHEWRLKQYIVAKARPPVQASKIPCIPACKINKILDGLQ